MKLNSTHFEKLSQLFLDIAKAMFIATFATPILSSAINAVNSLSALLTGFIFTYFSLITTSRKE